MNGDLRVGLFIEGNAAGGQAAAASVRSAVAGMKIDVQAAAEQFVGLDRSQKSASESAQVFITALDAERAKFNAIRASIDPVFASNQRYEQIVAQTRSAVDLGAVSQREANTLLDQAAVRYGKVAAAVGLNRIQQMEAMHVSRELVTMWATGIPIEQAFGMEAARIATFFQSGDGGVTGTLETAATAVGSFTSGIANFIGPWGLAVAGITAGTAAIAYLTGQFKDGHKTIKQFDADAKSLNKTLGELRAAARNAAIPVADLYRDFGQDAVAMHALYSQTLAYQEVLAKNSVAKAMKDLVSNFGDLSKIINEMESQKNSAIPGIFSKGTAPILEELQQYHREIGLNLTDTRALNTAMASFADAKTWHDRIAAVASMIHALEDARDKTGEVPPKVKAIIDSLTKAATAMGVLDSSAQHALGTFGALADATRTPEQRLLGLQIKNGLVPDVPSARAAATGQKENWFIHKPYVDLPPNPTNHLTAAQRQQKAVNEVIASLKAEHSALATLDPVQQQMLKYRRQLAEATVTQREKIKELITENIAEKNAVQAAQGAQKTFAEAAYTGIDDLVFKAKTLKDAFLDVANSIWQAFLKAELLGSGPLAGILGTKSTTGTGGLLGDIFQAIFPAVASPAASVGGTAEHLIGHAAGGYLTGPGTGTSDSILMWGSNGEFMVNAAATSKHRKLLEAINADALPAFASGGIVGTSGPLAAVASPTPSRGSPSTLELHVHVHGANGDPHIINLVRHGVAEGLQHFKAHELPYAVKEIHDDPWTVGAP